MSTRSGKRIHGSLHENAVKTDIETAPKSERKTRSKHMKENIEGQNMVLQKIKKRENYVSYPTDDEQVGDSANLTENDGNTRTLRKNALKDHNLIPTGISDCEPLPKNVRSTRRTRKFAENITEIAVNVEVPVITEAPEIKTKKGKRKKTLSEGPGQTEKPKKKNKKRKGRRSNSFVTENIEEAVVNNVNRSIISNDSFHSAAGSPTQDVDIKELQVTEDVVSVEDKPEISNKKFKKSKSLNKSIEKNNSVIEEINISSTKNGTFDVEPQRRSSIKNSSMENIINGVITNKISGGNISLSKDVDSNVSQSKNDTFDIEPQRRSIKTDSPLKMNTTFEKNTSLKLNSSKSSKRNSTIDVVDSPVDITALDEGKPTNIQSPLLNNTYDKSETSVKVNTTFELDKISLTSPNKRQSTIINTTFEKEMEPPKTKKRRSESLINQSNIKSLVLYGNTESGSLNATFESKNKSIEKLNNTFNKEVQLNTTFEKDPKLNTTFDKHSKSSLISPDSNAEDISRISITSDESITEPQSESAKQITIMNETPVLIDSSVDDSLISEDITPEPIVPTPIRREGTFTKDGPDDPNKSNDLVVTPRKNMSISGPGSTPFPNRSLTKEKPLLNVTRSIEKSRKSGVESAPRTTRVMFCSPVNNPVVVAQQKRMVIKSNLKGSNKSFVYEEIDSVSAVRPSARKRSYTHSEAEATRAKRERLADDLRLSGHRLPRHRTSSASGKLTDISTPTKKSTTPSKAKVSRTKLPNFAALHQKQFDKMESLDECQERKAKRARQLLTPVAATNLPEKSPKVATDVQKDQPKKEVFKKVETPIKSFTQEASKPAYTRFGFKLNLDVNPFSIPSKTVVKPKESNNKLVRQATLPSLAGATSMRREVAKQVVMREKSFTDKRQLKRNENRAIIKGVRTNRRFELQMKLRNIE